jgi:UrcA family protein
MNTMSTAKTVAKLVGAALIASLGVGFAALPAAAADDEPKVEVRFADLDVSTPHGATLLYGRIRSAAATVCTPLDVGGSLAAKAKVTACINRATADAVLKVNTPELTAIFDAKSGKAPSNRVAVQK